MSIFDELTRGVSTRSPEETRGLARRLAEDLPDDAVITLRGDLGAGKTVFVKGLATGLGVKTEVTSPTFTIFSIYEGTRRLIHLDAYRIDNENQMDALMLDDFLVSPFCLAIEWPEKIPGWLPENRLNFTFEIDSSRQIHHIRQE